MVVEEEFNDSSCVQYYLFLDSRYRTTLLSFHLNGNLISKVALRFTFYNIYYAV